MKTKISLLLFLCFPVVTFAQAGMWTWVKGSSTNKPSGSFGTQGVESPTNVPPGFYQPAQWTDLEGNFWLFGGQNTTSSDCHGDLWKYNPVTNNWTWIKGTAQINTTGNYGVQGVSSPSNLPRARSWGVSTWVDLNGDLWMYGGATGGNLLGDLWKYHIASNEWTWVSGSSSLNAPRVYGTMGVPSVSNTPGGRCKTNANWVDADNNLWLFGGYLTSPAFNDLWRYNISTNEWTWMKGSNQTNHAGVYGTKGVPDPANMPSARLVYSSWKDLNGNFWIFGGARGVFSGYLNDMWMYNPATNNWTWMSGTSQAENNGVYSAKCNSSVNNLPAGRWENQACWTDDCGNFWMYGGGRGSGLSTAYSDLWCFNPSTREWSLANGNSTPNQAPVYGTMGVPAAANTPGGRGGSVHWKSNSGELYLFGGSVNGYLKPYNDLWKFQIDAACTPSSLQPFSIGNDTSFCGTINKTLSTGNPATLWSTGVTAAQITVTAEGTYWATISNTCGSRTDSIKISQQTAPAISISNDTLICLGSTVTLNASGAADYSWMPSAGLTCTNCANPSATPGVTTTYTVNGYSGTCSDSKQVIVEVGNIFQAGTITALRDTICEGTPASLTVSGNSGTIRWQSALIQGNFSDIAGANSTSYSSVLSQSTYFRVIAGSGNCADTSNAYKLVTAPSPVAAFTGAGSGLQVTFNSDSSKGATIYEWDFGDGTSGSEPNPQHTYSAAGTYHVCLTVYNGSNCSFTICKDISIITGVTPISKEDNWKIYPAPLNDYLFIVSENNEQIESIEICDVLGRKVLHKKPDGIKEELYRIEIFNLASGIYYLRINTKQMKYIYPIVKQ